MFIIFRIDISHSQIIPEWVSTYSNSNDSDAGISLALDRSGNIFVTGISSGLEASTDIVTLKYNSMGVRLWAKSYHFGGNSHSEATDIAVDGSGNVYVTGYSSREYLTIKYNISGDQVWIRRYHGPSSFPDDKSYSIAIDNDDNIYITGGSKDGKYYFDFATIKYDSSGTQLWVQRYNGPGNGNDVAGSIAADLYGNIYITGYSSGDSTFADFCTIKYNSSGQQQWVNRYDGIGGFDDAAKSITIDDNGNVYVTGYSYGNETFRDFATIKYNNSGDLLWGKRFSGTGFSSDESVEVTTDLNGNVYVIGVSDEMNGNKSDFVTLKYNAGGDQLWFQRYNGTGNGIDAPTSVVTGRNGNVYVTGYSFGIGENTDILTIAYDSMGVNQWIDRRDGSAHNSDIAKSMVIDSSDNLFLTGFITEIGSYINFVTIKYSLTTGINFISNQISEKFALQQNYPNPFNPVTKIKFEIPQDIKRVTQYVKLIIYDALGKELQVLVNEILNAGLYETEFNGNNFASGVYFYKLESGDFVETKRMILLK